MWEKNMNTKVVEIARNTLELRSSKKREGKQQGAGKRRKMLRYYILEDDWGNRKEGKMTPKGVEEELKEKSSTKRGGGAQEIQTSQHFHNPSHLS